MLTPRIAGSVLCCWAFTGVLGVYSHPLFNKSNSKSFTLPHYGRHLFGKVTTRKSTSVGGGGGRDFDHVATLGGPQNIVKMVRVFMRDFMRVGRRMDVLEVTYLLRNGQTRTLTQGGGGGHARGPFDFTQHALCDIDLRSGGRIDLRKIWLSWCSMSAMK